MSRLAHTKHHHPAIPMVRTVNIINYDEVSSESQDRSIVVWKHYDDNPNLSFGESFRVNNLNEGISGEIPDDKENRRVSEISKDNNSKTYYIPRLEENGSPFKHIAKEKKPNRHSFSGIQAKMEINFLNTSSIGRKSLDYNSFNYSDVQQNMMFTNCQKGGSLRCSRAMLAQFLEQDEGAAFLFSSKGENCRRRSGERYFNGKEFLQSRRRAIDSEEGSIFQNRRFGRYFD